VVQKRRLTHRCLQQRLKLLSPELFIGQKRPFQLWMPDAKPLDLTEITGIQLLEKVSWAGQPEQRQSMPSLPGQAVRFLIRTIGWLTQHNQQLRG
jgi:hypothetical protein